MMSYVEMRIWEDLYINDGFVVRQRRKEVVVGIQIGFDVVLDQINGYGNREKYV